MTLRGMTCDWQIGSLRGWPEGTGPVTGGGPLVIRFGGSLLERPDWPELAASLLEWPLPGRPRTFVVGGGGIVEGLRGIDRVRPIDGRVAHRLAIDGMGITARLVAATLGLPLVTSPGDRNALLDMAGWLAADPARGDRIPASWSVTSDSLAAVVAATGDLLLVKSVPPPLSGGTAGEPSLMSLATLGWVDGWFPEAAGRVARIGWTAPSR